MSRIFLRKATLRHDTWLKETARTVSIFCYPSWFFRILIYYNCLFLIVKNNQKVGYVSFLPFRFFASVFLLQMAVLPEFQSRKIGSIILSKMLNIMQRKLRIRKIYLHTLKERVKDWCKKKKYRVLVAIPSKIWVMYKIHKERVIKRRQKRKVSGQKF